MSLRLMCALLFAAWSFGGIGLSQETVWLRTGSPENTVFKLLPDSAGWELGVGRVGAMTSTDHGQHWTVGSGLPLPGIYYGGTRTRAGHLFIGSSGGYVYASTDLGITWHLSNPGWIAYSTLAVVATPAGSLLATSYAFYRSTDDGVSWNFIDLPVRATPVSLFCTPSGILLAGTFDKGIFRSTDDGVNWVAWGRGFPGVMVRSFLPAPAGGMYVTAGPGVYFTPDDGITWLSRSGDLPQVATYDLALNANHHLFLSCADSGVYISKNDGRNWKRFHSGIPTKLTYSLIVEPDGFMQVATDSGVFRTRHSTTLFSMPIDSLYFDTTKVGQYHEDSVMVRNHGTDLLVIDSVESDNRAFSVSPASASLGVGDSKWFRVRFSPYVFGPIPGTIKFISNAGTSPDEVKVLGIGKAPYLRLPAGGVAFGRTLLDSTGKVPAHLENIGNDTLVVQDIRSLDPQFGTQKTMLTVMRESDAVDTLTFRPVVLGKRTGKMVIQSNSTTAPDTLEVQGIGAGIPRLELSLRTIDFGPVRAYAHRDTTVQMKNRGTDTLHVTSALSPYPSFQCLSSKWLLAPGDSAVDTVRFYSGMFARISGPILITSDAPTSPDTINVSGRVPTKAELDDLAPVTDNALHNPYPNPCSFETLIRFDRLDPGPVTVAVYDLIGRRIEVLVDDVVATGSHHVIWRVAGHASGVYIVRYTAGEYANSRKVVVVR